VRLEDRPVHVIHDALVIRVPYRAFPGVSSSGRVVIDLGSLPATMTAPVIAIKSRIAVSVVVELLVESSGENRLRRNTVTGTEKMQPNR